MKKISTLLILLLLVKLTSAQSQLEGHDPFPNLTGPPGNDVIYDIDFDAQNRPWVGEGFVNAVPRCIAWFNGISWDTICAPSTIYNAYRNLEFDANGVLWLTGGSYLASYTNGNWTVYDDSAIGIPNGPLFTVTGLVIDSQGNKWFFVPNQPDNYLVKFDGTTFSVINESILANDTSSYFGNTIFIDAQDHIYITAPTADSILVYDGSTFSRFDFYGLQPPSGYKIKRSVFDSFTNNFWTLLGNNSDSIILAKYTAGTWQLTPAYLPPYDPVFSQMVIDSQGRVWVCNGHGLTEFDGTSFQSWVLNLISNYTVHIEVDNNDDLWITIEGQSSPNTVYRFLTNNLHSFHGTIWNDSNGDGIHDSTETTMTNVVVGQQPENYTSFTSSTGNYSLVYLDSLQTYTIVCTPPQYWTQTYPVSAVTVNPSTQSTSGIDFGVAPIPGITDVNVLINTTAARPGFGMQQDIVYCNSGTTTVSDSITYVYDPQLSFISATPAPDVTNGNTLQWHYSSLPMDCGIIHLLFHLDSTAVIGDTLNSDITIQPVSGDTVPGDNTYHLTQTIRGSYDPNEKSVYPEGDIQFDERLHYLVQFQNTGTDTAFTVVIKDSLDSKLDYSSLRIESSSHPMTSSLSPFGLLEFRFANIFLPDSITDETLSHGFVRYSIKPKAGVPLNSTINNRAAIYFDFNVPVLTNVTGSKVTSTVTIEEIGQDNLMLWPNPAEDKISIDTRIKALWHLRIFDLSGEQFLKKDFMGSVYTIDVDDLPEGIYLIRLESRGHTLVRKFLKR